METNPTIQSLIDRGALFVVNHSGGKDSQAMTIYLQSIVPANQLVLVHAELPDADWDGIEQHIRTSHPGLRLETCVAVWRDGTPKKFLDMVEQRGFWPDASCRQCTSDLKRTPIEVVIRRLSRETGRSLIVNCDGRRAAESTSRAKLNTFSRNSGLSKGGREVYNWLSIHDWSTAQVFAAIAAADQQPHWAYGKGMSRLSCCFCILASRQDLATAAALKPALFQRYNAIERKIDRTFVMPKGGRRLFLDEIVAQVRTETERLAA
jgi:3'-phosphoadenosine 5'-phosphosulfate sulfotransferase (PAPS reductase)/FAD synthetase